MTKRNVIKDTLHMAITYWGYSNTKSNRNIVTQFIK